MGRGVYLTEKNVELDGKGRWTHGILGGVDRQDKVTWMGWDGGL